MAEQISLVLPFDYELYEGDPDQLRTVDATPALPNSYIDPASLKLKYRIGHGLFGDVWVATHHQSGTDYDQYHEVAVKMLHPIKEGHENEFLHKFEELWRNSKSRNLQGVCWLHGITIISGKICIALKSYEGSIAERMAQMNGGKLSLADVLRYGIELAKEIQQLHQIGLLVLNLKPNNFLLDERDHVVLGDFGIPYLLLGIPWHDSQVAARLGTPNYMAPEQWQPGVRGPISYETDSWGFACSMIEMLTGAPPWFGRSPEEMHHAVVIRQEKPQVPTGLPPAVEDVLKGCFENDFRNRPLISRKAVYSDGSWSNQGSNLNVNKPHCSGYSTWFLSKDRLQIGDTVRSRKDSNTCKPISLAVKEGVVVGLEKDGERDAFVLVQTPNMHNQLRLNALTLERVTYGFASGDWIRLIRGNGQHASLGILHYIHRDGVAVVGFLGLKTLWRGHYSELKVVEPFSVGQFVRLKANITTPQFEWPHKRGRSWASGRISHVLPNGCLEVKFPGRFVLGDEHTCFLANPEEVERVSFDTCPGIMEKYELAEDFHWAVQPLAIAFGVFTATKIGKFVGRNVVGGLHKCGRNRKQNDTSTQEGQSNGNPAWLPPTVANIIFKEGTPITISRRHFHEDEEDEDELSKANANANAKPSFRDVDSIARQVSCISLHKRDSKKTFEEYFSCEKYGVWRQEQRNGAAKLKKQLRARWVIQKLIDEQLGRFKAHYCRAIAPTKMSDVAQLLMPKWAPPHQLAAVFWLGDWRPSTLLELLRSLAHSLGVWDPIGVERALSLLINDIRNEEAVIDEEMIEAQSNCVLHLPFGPVHHDHNGPGPGLGLAHVRSELRKIHRIIVKAQNLRMKAVEVAVKKVLSQSDAAEFLVALVGIQDVIHEVSTKFKTRNTLSALKNSDSFTPNWN
ncbi:Protein kinase superfamily protein [Perilla frutescens var. hirtella]|uniref:Protein kinase superfamily protein n=1 Tax=Perilla frutescens var. hirtella TaxID=608512 RepID=A0AAD4PAK3_PERFH|nr:Protein kinase superfamily protein [Perilla frutescens var. hirtella]